MDWSLSMAHILSGYIILIPVLLVYFVIQKNKRNKQTRAHQLMTYIFAFYLFGVLGMTGLWYTSSFSPVFVLVPSGELFTKEALLNILLFIPLGIFLPMLYKQFNTPLKVLIAGFLMSLSIEFIQMFELGATDINDLIMNTLGALLGFYIFKVISKVIPETWEHSLKSSNINAYNVVASLWIASIVIMLFIQPFVFKLIFPAL